MSNIFSPIFSRNAFLHFFGGLCFCLFLVFSGQVNAAEETRTIQNFILQDSATRSAGSQIDQTFSFVMTDDIVDVKNVFFDVSGISAVHSGQTINLSLDDNKTDGVYDFDEAGVAKAYTLDSTGGPTPFHLIYNVTNVMGASGNNCYVNSRGTRNCVISFRADNASIHGLTIKLVVTYRFTKAASAAAEETRTIQNFILQDSATRSAGSQIDQTFSFVMTDDIVDVKNVFFDVSGISAVHSGQTINLSLDDNKTDGVYDFDEAGVAKAYTLDSTGGPTPFHLIYNVTNVMGASGNNCYVNTRGTYNCTVSFRADNTSVHALSVKLVVTYRFRPPAGGGGSIPASGTYISPTYDSKIASDDAGGTVSKSGFNTISWIEDVSNGTLVKALYVAAADTTPPATFLGADGSNEATCESSNLCYSRSNTTHCSSVSLGSSRYEVTCRINIGQHNLRYFRYKAKLCNEKTSPSQCNGGNGSFSPKIEKVILNWSP